MEYNKKRNVLPIQKRPMIDIAPFARLVTGDPNRLSGCSANHIQEFFAEDVFLEWDVCVEKDDMYKILPSKSGMACIGLRWLENRKPFQLAIEFAEKSDVPSVSSTQVQMWSGQSAWQGEWRNLKGEVGQEGKRLVCTVKEVPRFSFKTRKIRWVFSNLTNAILVKYLSASCLAKFKMMDISLQFEQGTSKGKANLELYNAEVETDAGFKTNYVWSDTKKAVELKLRVARTHLEPVQTGAFLRIRSATGTTAVSLDDLLANGCVYVPQNGLYVTKGPDFVRLKDYKQQIAQKKTILERVRAMPDQTFAQAMEKTHVPIQDNGPMMLSLACDNFKFVSDRDASISVFKVELEPILHTVFGTEQNLKTERHLEGGWLPIPVVTASSGGITYTQHIYVAPFDDSGDSRKWPYLCDRPICVAEYAMENKNDVESDVLLSLQFHTPPKDTEPLELAWNQSGIAVHHKGRVLALVDLTEIKSLKSDITDGRITITGKLSQKETAHCYVTIPTWDVTVADSAMLAIKGGLHKEVKTHWERVLAGAMEVEIPDSLLQNTARASQVHCMIAARNEDNGRRIAAWIASVSYGPWESESHSVIRGMDFFGHEKFAEQSLEYFIKRYDSAGFLTTGYTLFGTGWHLWTLGEHVALTQNTPWLKNHEAEIAKVCQWVTKQWQKTQRMDCSGKKVIEYGLMPPGVCADWNVFAYHYALSGYYYAGLKASADALAQVGYNGAAELQKDAADFRRDIIQSYRRMQSLSPVVNLQNGTSVTNYPSQAYLCGPINNFFAGEDHNRAWAYDVEVGAHQLVSAGVIDALGSDVGGMMEHMEDVQFLQDGWHEYPSDKSKADWYNLGGFSKVQPYYCRNAEIYAMRDDVKPFIRSYFNTLASSLSSENLSIWEHFHNVCAWNKTHETGYFLYQTRTMLLTERAGDLWIAPFVTNNWLKDGLSIKVKNAPTQFGKVSYQLDSHIKSGYIEAVVEMPKNESTPNWLFISFRHPEEKCMKTVTVNGKVYEDFNTEKEYIRIKPVAGVIKVRAEY